MKAKPEKSCNDTVLKYVLKTSEVEAAKQQIIQIAGGNPVIFVEMPRDSDQVELMVIAAKLTPSQQGTLEELQQDGNMVKRIASADFAVNQVSFGSP